MKKLGDLLSERIAQEKNNPILRLEREAKESGQDAIDNLKYVYDYFENMKEMISTSIKNGTSLPIFKVGKLNDELGDKRINQLLTPVRWNENKLVSYYEPIWTAVVRWAHSENLQLSWVQNHDGGGMDSWFELKIDSIKPTQQSNQSNQNYRSRRRGPSVRC